jgi:FMN phosphatase YigB (HAD superfamily)
MDEVRVGLAGCGLFGQSHLRAFRAIPGARVAAVHDPDRERTASRAREFDIPLVCGSLEELTAATGGRRLITVGKPDPSILRGVCERCNLRLDEIAMVGDRLYAVMAMARKAGVSGILVRSDSRRGGPAGTCPGPGSAGCRRIGPAVAVRAYS